MRRRQRLLVEYVEHCAGDMAVVDCRQQVILDEMAAAADVHYVTASRHRAKRAGTEYARCFICQRKRIHDYARTRQKGFQFSITCKALDTIDTGSRTTPRARTA